jgi:hypothetical protein
MKKLLWLHGAYEGKDGGQKPGDPGCKFSSRKNHPPNAGNGHPGGEVDADQPNDVDDPSSEPWPRITRFIAREAALIKNPELAKIVLREQPPRQLKAAH